MNERIEKLAMNYANKMGNSVLHNAEHLEKFAELIVQECGVALSPMLRDMISRGKAFDLIKEHFGVNMNDQDYDEQGGERGWAER